MNRTLTVLYRTYGGENDGLRPAWYSKPLCLESLLIAIKRAQQDGDVNLVVVHDGPLNENASWTTTLERRTGPVGTIRECLKLGNAGSFRHAFHLALDLPEDELVLFAEDDYLWLEDSIAAMREALLTLPADYVTGYDHPDRYRPPDAGGTDVPHHHQRIHLAAGRHWRPQESTCMTFMTTTSRLRADLLVFEAHADAGHGAPADWLLFRRLQGLMPGERLYVERPALLCGPMPSLNTHAHLPWLAPLVDWARYADGVRASMS